MNRNQRKVVVVMQGPEKAFRSCSQSSATEGTCAGTVRVAISLSLGVDGGDPKTYGNFTGRAQLNQHFLKGERKRGIGIEDLSILGNYWIFLATWSYFIVYIIFFWV